MSGVIRIRFVAGNDALSALIQAQGGTAMPFTPSHVESLSQDGKFYIGQHMRGGMEARPVGYDAGQIMVLPDGRLADIIVSLPCTEAQEAAYYAFIHSKIGQSYDWISILGFVLTEMHLHTVGSLICSAITTAACRTKGCEYFPMPLTVPFHKISPRDLMLMFSSHVEISH